jgi:hypothetical protein
LGLEVHRIFNQQHAGARVNGFGSATATAADGAGFYHQAGITLPLLNRFAGDAAVAPGRLPGIEVTTVDHQLDRADRHAQHAGGFQGADMLLRERQVKFACYFAHG